MTMYLFKRSSLLIYVLLTTELQQYQIKVWPKSCKFKCQCCRKWTPPLLTIWYLIFALLRLIRLLIIARCVLARISLCISFGSLVCSTQLHALVPLFEYQQNMTQRAALPRRIEIRCDAIMGIKHEGPRQVAVLFKTRGK